MNMTRYTFVPSTWPWQECVYGTMPWLLPLYWRHNGHEGVSNHQPYYCLLIRLFRRRSKKTPKPRVAGLWPVNSTHNVNRHHVNVTCEYNLFVQQKTYSGSKMNWGTYLRRCIYIQIYKRTYIYISIYYWKSPSTMQKLKRLPSTVS